MREEDIIEYDVNETKGDEQDQVIVEDGLEYVDSEIEDDETEIIYQRFLENHKKKENELRKSCCTNAEFNISLNIEAQMCTD